MESRGRPVPCCPSCLEVQTSLLYRHQGAHYHQNLVHVEVVEKAERSPGSAVCLPFVYPYFQPSSWRTHGRSQLPLQDRVALQGD